jgi:DNA-binding SARP family transcriptional activator
MQRSEPGGAPVQLRILGPVEAWAGQERIRLGGPLQERVLATLLLEANRVVPLSRLVESVWHENPPATAPHQVRKIVADLRRRLPGGAQLLVTDGAGYVAATAPDQLDLTLFGVRLGRARDAAAAGLHANARDQLREALDLWRGPIMGGMGGPIIEAAAAALDERRLAAAEQLIDLTLGLGEAADVIGDLRALVAQHPLRESMRAKLMLALYQCGRQADALEEYTAARRILADELGVDPGQELVRMYEAILHSSPELSPPKQPEPAAASAPWTTPAPLTGPPCSLPHDLPDFTGRGEELAALTTAATAPGAAIRLITIDGMGGSGKTSLAIHAAHSLAQHYPDGQLYVDLRGFSPQQDPMEPGAALDLMLRTLGVPGDRIPDDTPSRAALWRVVTASRRLLVLLDNAADTAQIRPLLPGSRDGLVLVTSRVRMIDLDGAVAVTTGQMSTRDSLALLEVTLGAGRVAAEPGAAAALVALCGRLPLALRVAAARLRGRGRWTIQDLVARLETEASRLGELAAGERSVSATIALSYRAMPAPQRAFIRHLGAHPGTDFDVHTAAALAGLPASRADRLLEQLLDSNLLEQHSSGRHTFHDLIRSYIQDLIGTGEYGAAQRLAQHRLLDDYLAASDAAARVLQPGREQLPLPLEHPGGGRPPIETPADALRWFDDERHNLLAAVHLAARDGFDPHAVHLPRALAHYLQIRGLLGDDLEVLQIAVDAARRLGDRDLEALSLMNLASPYWHLGSPRQALACVGEALAIAAETGDTQREAACLARIGTQYSSLGDYPEGARRLTRALELNRSLGDARGECWTLVNLSSALVALGRYEQALASATDARRIAGTLGDGDATIMALVNAANAHNGLGDHDAALRELADALPIARETGALDGFALVLTRLADTHCRAGSLDTAFAHAVDAVERARTIRRSALVATVENILGTIHRKRGEFQAALSRHENALDAAREAEFRIEIARAYAGMAAAAEAQNRDEDAVRFGECARAHFDAMGVPDPAPGAMARAH